MRRTPRRPFVRREEAAQHKINQKILAPEVRLVVEGSEPMVVATLKAIDMAMEEGLDLVFRFPQRLSLRFVKSWITRSFFTIKRENKKS